MTRSVKGAGGAAVAEMDHQIVQGGLAVTRVEGIRARQRGQNGAVVLAIAQAIERVVVATVGGNHRSSGQIRHAEGAGDRRVGVGDSAGAANGAAAIGCQPGFACRQRRQQVDVEGEGTAGSRDDANSKQGGVEVLGRSGGLVAIVSASVTVHQAGDNHSAVITHAQAKAAAAVERSLVKQSDAIGLVELHRESMARDPWAGEHLAGNRVDDGRNGRNSTAARPSGC